MKQMSKKMIYYYLLTCVSTASCCISWFCSAVMLPESLYCCSVCSTSACVLLPRARPSTRKLWSASSDWRHESTLVFTIEHGVLGYLRVCDDLRGLRLLCLGQLVAGELCAEVGHHLVVDLLVVHALCLPLPPATSGKDN